MCVEVELLPVDFTLHAAAADKADLAVPMPSSRVFWLIASECGAASHICKGAEKRKLEIERKFKKDFSSFHGQFHRSISAKFLRIDYILLSRKITL